MPRKSDEIIKGFIGEIGVLIDARNKTLEINLMGHVDSAIKASEARIRKDMATKEDIKNMATKEDIKNMATKEDIKNMATKEDIFKLAQKIDKSNALQNQLDELKERVKILEENVGLHN